MLFDDVGGGVGISEHLMDLRIYTKTSVSVGRGLFVSCLMVWVGEGRLEQPIDFRLRTKTSWQVSVACLLFDNLSGGVGVEIEAFDGTRN